MELRTLNPAHRPRWSWGRPVGGHRSRPGDATPLAQPVPTEARSLRVPEHEVGVSITGTDDDPRVGPGRSLDLRSPFLIVPVAFAPRLDET